jgi:hypothetical protein
MARLNRKTGRRKYENGMRKCNHDEEENIGNF